MEVYSNLILVPTPAFYTFPNEHLIESTRQITGTARKSGIDESLIGADLDETRPKTETLGSGTDRPQIRRAVNIAQCILLKSMETMILLGLG